MLSVVMLTGLLRQKNSNFEGVTRRKFAEIGMFASKLSVQLGLHLDHFNVETLTRRQFSVCRGAQGFSFMRAGFRSPLPIFFASQTQKIRCK